MAQVIFRLESTIADAPSNDAAEEMDGVMSQVRLHSPDPVVEDSGSVASSALRRWRWAVRGSPSTSASDDQARIALRGHVVSFERICVDDQYDVPAPIDGLDALTIQEEGSDSLVDQRVVVTCWAVRIAQEMAKLPRRRIAADAGPASALLARANLDLPLQGAIDWLG